MTNYETMIDEISKLKGVEDAYVVVNDSWNYSHVCQMPPKSIRVCVKGGKKKKIGKLIYKYKELGVLAVGNTEVYVDVGHGLEYKYHFEAIL